MKTLTLELLRPGPAAGQLLSPLTPYLALCEGAPAETVHLPFDHRDFLRRLVPLRYGLGAAGQHEPARQDALEEMRADMTALLRQIKALPGLIERAEGEAIHLRLLLSATELAALPFELANVPAGVAGEGQPIELVGGDARPLVITREARRDRRRTVRWPTRPRVLFAHVSQANLPEEVVTAHHLALARALAPWAGWETTDDGVPKLDHLLKVLPAASVSSIARACREEAFTHVHILAHGKSITEPHTLERRFGLALHRDGSEDEVVTVDATELTAAFINNDHPLPTFVTVAACDSGNVGSVIALGGSLAHALHDAGVPFVVASQFPLSMRGSVIATDALYEGLLDGTDPRLAVLQAKRRLMQGPTSRHDAPSLVVYSSLTDSANPHLRKVRIARLKRAVDSTLASLNRGDQKEARQLARLEGWLAQLAGVIRDGSLAERVDHRGFLGSVAIRWCDPDWPKPRGSGPTPRRASPEPSARGEGDGVVELPITKTTEVLALAQAARHYAAVFRLDPTKLWAGVLELFFGWLLEEEEQLDEDLFAALWTLQRRARVVAKRKRDALGAAIELRLLAPLAPRRAALHEGLGDEIEEYLREVGVGSYHAYALSRQLLRYARWWLPMRGGDIANSIAREAERWRAELEARGVRTSWDER